MWGMWCESLLRLVQGNHGLGDSHLRAPPPAARWVGSAAPGPLPPPLPLVPPLLPPRVSPAVVVLLTPLTLHACSLCHAAQSPLSLVRQDAYASLAASLDGYLADSAKAAAVLPALGRVWPELLQSIALGLRQAPISRPASQPAAGGQPSPAGGAAGAAATQVSYRAVSPAELTSLVHVLVLACLLAPQARQSSLAAGLLPLLLAQLPRAPPELACACLDSLLAAQMRCPAAFLSFTEQRGVQQVCHLMRDKSTSEPVRGQAVQFINLLLTQVSWLG
jgi:hypothetical protein